MALIDVLAAADPDNPGGWGTLDAPAPRLPQLIPVDHDPFAGLAMGDPEAAGAAAASQAMMPAVNRLGSPFVSAPSFLDQVDRERRATAEREDALGRPLTLAERLNVMPLTESPGFAFGLGLAGGRTGGEAPRGLIRNEDLDTILPLENRRVGPYQEGVGTTPVAGGADWRDLDYSKPIGGMQASPEALQKAWSDAAETVRGWSPQQAEALDKYLADHPEVGPNTPEFWNDALSQTDKERYWYERGTTKFLDEGLDQHPEDMRDTMNVAAATSPSAEPLQNLQRTHGVMAEHQQNLPISTDVIVPGAVRMALGDEMQAPKTSNYTGTFLHIAGVDNRPPLSVNDRQMAEIHGIDPEVLAKRPDLYALLSKFDQNLRDAENAARPGVAAGLENPFETWHLQAPGWAHVRGVKNPAKTGVSDDYMDVMDKYLRPQLEAAGIDTSPGLWSREVLGHPDTPNVMSSTRAQYLASPTATIETATTMTPEGQRATQLLSRLPSGPEAPLWANKARYEMERVQRQSMQALTTGGQNSVVSKLVAPVLGVRGAAVTRADTTGWGTYGGDINPNLRLPMWAATKDGRVTLGAEHIRPVLSAIGDAFGQEGVAASHFETIAPGADTGGRQGTYSVFLPGPQASTAQLQQFRQGIGSEISVRHAANGTLVDVHPSFETGLSPSREQMLAATNSAFAGSAPDAHIIHRAYASHYFEHQSQNAAENYSTHIEDFWKGQRHEDTLGERTGGVRAAYGTAGERAGDFEKARDEARAIAADQRARTHQWSEQYQPRIEKWEQNPAGRGRQLRPLAGPQLIPVDHDPFAIGPAPPGGPLPFQASP